MLIQSHHRTKTPIKQSLNSKQINRLPIFVYGYCDMMMFLYGSGQHIRRLAFDSRYIQLISGFQCLLKLNLNNFKKLKYLNHATF